MTITARIATRAPGIAAATGLGLAVGAISLAARTIEIRNTMSPGGSEDGEKWRQ